MKNKSAKISKMLYKANLMKNEAFAVKKEKKYLSKINSAEKLCRKALELSRTDITNGVNNGFNDLIGSIYSLASLFYRTGRINEAETLLSEARSLEGFEGHMYSIAINSYYGCILCDRGEYDVAGVIFDKIMDDAVANEYAAFIDAYALCEAYGNAACAFTYADTGVGYNSDRFTEPFDRLLKIKQKGFDVRDNAIKKAAYFAASQRLYYMCFEAPTSSNSDSTIKTAELCLEFCESSAELDFYLPAAMRIIAFATARDCRFGDCAELCGKILEICSKYSGDMCRSPYGSIQDIAADANLLLGIMHYRANHFELCLKYFDAAIAAIESDAQGKPLNAIGYVEVEAVIIAMTSAEKAAFAYKYKGLAMFRVGEKHNLTECISMMQKGIELITSISDDPYFYLRASSEYTIMAKLCSEAGDLVNSSKFNDLSRKYGYFALSNLDKCPEDNELYDKYLNLARSRKRLALRHGLLEQYSDCLRYEIMLCEEPYTKSDHRVLAELNYHMGEYCRIVDRYESAVEYYEKVRSHTFDENGNMYDELKTCLVSENAMLAMAASLVKLGKMTEARRAFKEFIEVDKITSGGELSLEERIRIAKLSSNIQLNSAECAEYIHIAATMSVEEGDDCLRSADLLNHEGLCWYNASPENDDHEADCDCDECRQSREKFESESERHARLTEKFAVRELDAFKKSHCELLKCDQNHPIVLVLMPSLLSNIAECYVRREDLEEGLKYYQKSVNAFETLFASQTFAQKNDEAKKAYVFQYGIGFKFIGEIYERVNKSENSAKALTQAIEVFEKIDSEDARNQLALCLNARGCINYRLGNYQNEVDDVTRAISLQSSEVRGSEVPIAIMLKNRSEAHQALGNYYAMHDDLTESIKMLDNSEAPEGSLDSIYGEHWYSLGICQEEMEKVGHAADSYRKAEKYLVSSKSSDDVTNVLMRVMCHFRRANCMYLRDEQEYYGALSEYDNAVKLLDKLPPSVEKNQRLMAVLASRGKLYETFREIDLAKADYERVEQLSKDSPKSIFSTEN